MEAKDGSWIPADPQPGALVVNIGDIIDALTSHAYKSTYHRVIHRGSKYRVSMPFFFEPPRDMEIRPIPEMVPEGQEAGKPFVYFEHLKVSSDTQLGREMVRKEGAGTDGQSMIYRHFVANDQPLPEKPNANELTQRG